jgi:hypothetical protein
MNGMKLKLLVMGFILIILSIALVIKRYSLDDFILTTAGIVLLGIGIVWKNAGTKKIAPQTSVS